ncbi:MAG: hypothetical protein QM778_33135 [Myxococcales bacterium]
MERDDVERLVRVEEQVTGLRSDVTELKGIVQEIRDRPDVIGFLWKHRKVVGVLIALAIGGAPLAHALFTVLP